MAACRPISAMRSEPSGTCAGQNPFSESMRLGGAPHSLPSGFVSPRSAPVPRRNASPGPIGAVRAPTVPLASVRARHNRDTPRVFVLDKGVLTGTRCLQCHGAPAIRPVSHAEGEGVADCRGRSRSAGRASRRLLSSHRDELPVGERRPVAMLPVVAYQTQENPVEDGNHEKVLFGRGRERI